MLSGAVTHEGQGEREVDDGGGVACSRDHTNMFGRMAAGRIIKEICSATLCDFSGGKGGVCIGTLQKTLRPEVSQ